MLDFRLTHIAAGGNRHPAAADWKGNVLAFGSGKNIAVRCNGDEAGIGQLLRSHTDDVSSVRILERSHGSPLIVSGSVDHTVRVWSAKTHNYEEICSVSHDGAVNTLAILPEADIIISGAADATVKIWKLAHAADGSNVGCKPDEESPHQLENREADIWSNR